MYRKTRFLEELIAIREEMSRECDYDVEMFAEMIRSGKHPAPRIPVRIKTASRPEQRKRTEEDSGE